MQLRVIRATTVVALIVGCLLVSVPAVAAATTEPYTNEGEITLQPADGDVQAQNHRVCSVQYGQQGVRQPGSVYNITFGGRSDCTAITVMAGQSFLYRLALDGWDRIADAAPYALSGLSGASNGQSNFNPEGTYRLQFRLEMITTDGETFTTVDLNLYRQCTGWGTSYIRCNFEDIRMWTLL